MANVWTQFKELIPSDYQYIGTVLTVNADDTSLIALVSDNTQHVLVIGSTVLVGKDVLIKGNMIIKEVPTLPTYSHDI